MSYSWGPWSVSTLFILHWSSIYGLNSYKNNDAVQASGESQTRAFHATRNGGSKAEWKTHSDLLVLVYICCSILASKEDRKCRLIPLLNFLLKYTITSFANFWTFELNSILLIQIIAYLSPLFSIIVKCVHWVLKFHTMSLLMKYVFSD